MPVCMQSMSTPSHIWTIGHSTHPQEEFVEMLQSFGIKTLADIRHFPGSRRFPYFNKEAMQAWLPANNIRYVHLVDLGGRRKTSPQSHNTAWHHAAFRGYADYMETPAFAQAIKQLQELAHEQPTAYMCSEAVWWSCHRSLVSDYLKSKGWEVTHIMGIGKSQEHPYTKPARIVDGKLSYRDPSQLF